MKQRIQKGSPSIRDIVEDTRQQKVPTLNFLATGLGIALIFGMIMFLGR
jgi:hypothetical protein